MFVDDTAITGNGKTNTEVISNIAIQVVEAHEMRINLDKNVLIARDKDMEITLGGTPLKASESERYLGLWISSGRDPLKACIAKKMEQSEKYQKLVRRTGWTRKDMPAVASRLLLQTYIWPRIAFGIEVWGQVPGGRKIWTDWMGILSGAGPGGGSAARALNGWMDFEGEMGILAARIFLTASEEDIDMPISPRRINWDGDTVLGNLARQSRRLVKYGTPGTLGAKLDLAKRNAWIKLAKRVKSRTAESLIERLGARNAGKALMGKPQTKRNITKGETRGEWTRKVVMSSNVSPSPSSSKEGVYRSIAYLAVDEELKVSIRKLCPLCTLNSEVEVLQDILDNHITGQAREDKIRKWTEDSRLGSASHIICECPAVDRGPRWPALLERARRETSGSRLRRRAGFGWYEDRPILELHSMMAWNKDEIWKGLEEGMKGLGKVGEQIGLD
ncbi:hypothetical protein J8273_8721 [Carpediemonas membranifera]|uniref:Reverse transcriptase domain-containing protein n=1 Tax=Carpediemonas membranifera TaxID=201153 RepID=A0A8J6AP24_9EUKA|nr:hypothetical protein J8273_8721 [Carpediemonas membranifera]|eukprot:KAG9389431.1 hypothetical protein J8273_8721 [Carpediemonas membranifera]